MVIISTFGHDTSIMKPRRVMRYVLIYCSSGQIVMAIDDKEFSLRAGELITITSGQTHYIKDLIQADGYILEFTLDYFCKNDHDIELIFQNGLFCHFDLNEVISVDPVFIKEQLDQIQNELNMQPYQYLISVHSRIELILVLINRTKVDRGDEIWKPEALFLKFLEAVRNNFHQQFNVAQWAEQLNTTETKLNELAKYHAGKTAQNVIYGLIASEAKRLLRYESLSVKEVGYKLGFNDPFYFSNFFKKHTAMSPKQYKAQYAR